MNRQYRFELECPVCNKQSEMTWDWDKRDLTPISCMVSCSGCYKQRGELVPMKVLRGEVLANG
jgi:hypothetical protein